LVTKLRCDGPGYVIAYGAAELIAAEAAELIAAG
jgi:hypothetical protein